MKRIGLILLIATLPLLAGCSNAQEKGSAGAVLGGIAGGIIGHQSDHTWQGAAIGTAAGGALGYMVGNEQDKDEIRNGRRGHYEVREEKVWVPGYTEKRWVEPVYETKCDATGRPYKVLLSDGHYEYVNHDGYWEVKQVRVWVEN